jgi:elongation factor Ts
MEQGLISDEKRTVKDLLTDAVAKTGENIQLARFVRFSLGE